MDWKLRPKFMFSKLLIAVSAKTKICEPRNPPRMVIPLDEPSCALNSCIPAKVMRQRVEAMTHETDVGTAILLKIRCFRVLKNLMKMKC